MSRTPTDAVKLSLVKALKAFTANLVNTAEFSDFRVLYETGTGTVIENSDHRRFVIRVEEKDVRHFSQL